MDSKAVVTIVVGIVLCVCVAIAIYNPKATVTRTTAGAGVVLVVWGQIFLVFGFIAAWRLLFAPAAAIPQLPTATPLADYAELIKALTAAPNWISLTGVGSAQTVVGIILLQVGTE